MIKNKKCKLCKKENATMYKFGNLLCKNCNNKLIQTLTCVKPPMEVKIWAEKRKL